jgi:hypothetical protein
MHDRQGLRRLDIGAGACGACCGPGGVEWQLGRRDRRSTAPPAWHQCKRSAAQRKGQRIEGRVHGGASAVRLWGRWVTSCAERNSAQRYSHRPRVTALMAPALHTSSPLCAHTASPGPTHHHLCRDTSATPASVSGPHRWPVAPRAPAGSADSLGYSHGDQRARGAALPVREGHCQDVLRSSPPRALQQLRSHLGLPGTLRGATGRWCGRAAGDWRSIFWAAPPRLETCGGP